MRPRILTGVLLMSALFAGDALAMGTGREREILRLRAATAQGRALVDDALRKSATIRDLAREIASSDLIVYVDVSTRFDPGRAGTKLVAAHPGTRYLRISLSALTPMFEQIPLLAHELQHAVEIARAPHIRDAASLRAHYVQIGEDPAAHTGFETADARLVQRKVRKEYFRK